MADERLSGLALMYIHRNVPLNSKDIIEKWYNLCNRRIQLFLNLNFSVFVLKFLLFCAR